MHITNMYVRAQEKPTKKSDKAIVIHTCYYRNIQCWILLQTGGEITNRDLCLIEAQQQNNIKELNYKTIKSVPTLFRTIKQ